MPPRGPGGRPTIADLRRAAALLVPLLLAACAAETPPGSTGPRPDDVRARVVALMPASVPDRAGWAVDLYAALASLRLEPSDANVCAVLSVAEQESGFHVDPSVPGLGRIAWREIDVRADRAGVPPLLVHAALKLPSTDGRSYAERLDAATTEKQLSDTFVDFIGRVPLGQRLFAGYNPVRTAGPMQVSVDFAERQVERQRARADALDLHVAPFAQPHDRAGAERLLNLADRVVEGLLLGRHRQRLA